MSATAATRSGIRLITVQGFVQITNRAGKFFSANVGSKSVANFCLLYPLASAFSQENFFVKFFAPPLTNCISRFLRIGFFLKSVSEKYSGRSCGGAGRLALLLLGHRFLSNMLPRRASPSSPPRSQPHRRTIFQTRSQRVGASHFLRPPIIPQPRSGLHPSHPSHSIWTKTFASDCGIGFDSTFSRLRICF
jgi:hypothetical protein